MAIAAVRLYQPTYGYCSGALGWDLAWGRALMLEGIPYCLALPWPGMGNNWDKDNIRKLATLKYNADKCMYLSSTYSKGAYIDRDRYMVMNAEGVVALLDPTATGSGTYHTYQFATKLGKPVINLWDAYSNYPCRAYLL